MNFHNNVQFFKRILGICFITKNDPKIVLIDGLELASLMIDNDIGENL